MDIYDIVQTLPANLEANALARFDDLETQGRLYYGAPQHRVVKHDSFTAGNPQLDKDSPARSQPGGPFANPDPAFVVAQNVGPSHYLTLNKYCVQRPMYLLPTINYKPQTEGLDATDLAAAWALIKAFDTPHMVFCNCGVEAGSSQGHKHLQVLPIQRPEGFKFFTDDAGISYNAPMTLPNAPHKHFIISLPHDPSLALLQNKFTQLMEMTYSALEGLSTTLSYNLIIIREWMMVAPRTHRDRDGIATNALGTIGMMCVKDDEEMQGCIRLGMTEPLKYLGMPASSQPV